MPMPVMDIGHVVVFMFLGGMFVFVRMDSIHFIMSVRGVIMFMAMLVEQDRMHVRMRMLFIDEQQRATNH